MLTDMLLKYCNYWIKDSKIQGFFVVILSHVGTWTERNFVPRSRLSPNIEERNYIKIVNLLNRQRI